MADTNKEEHTNKLLGELVAKAHECSKDAKKLISQLLNAVNEERDSKVAEVLRLEVLRLEEQLDAAKAELDRMKAIQTTETENGTGKTNEQLLAEQQALATGEEIVRRMKELIEENGRLAKEVERLGQPPTAPAAMRQGHKEDSETPKKEVTKPAQRQEGERRAEWPAPMAKTQRPQPQRQKRGHEEDDDAVAGAEGAAKRPKTEGKVKKKTPVCVDCHRKRRRDCDGKARCNNCAPGQCVYRPCRDGAECAKYKMQDCVFLHPDQRSADGGPRRTAGGRLGGLGIA